MWVGDCGAWASCFYHPLIYPAACCSQRGPRSPSEGQWFLWWAWSRGEEVLWGAWLPPLLEVCCHLSPRRVSTSTVLPWGGLWVSSGWLTLWSVLSCGGHSVSVSLDCLLGWHGGGVAAFRWHASTNNTHRTQTHTNINTHHI